MRSHAQVVVIGGGVVGCSVLYHLARAGWTNALLIERRELTSGSTWHAAGGVHTINGDPSVAKLQKYTVELYREIEERSGQATGLHLTGGLMLAATEARFDWLKGLLAKGRYLGMELELLTPRQAADLMPLLDPSAFVGALYDPIEGHLDPAGTTHAYAKCARQLGAQIVTQTRVTGLEQRPGGWRILTEAGAVECEHVVNAAGLWAREVGRMVGLELPILAMEHMYLLTDAMPEVEAFNEATGRQLLHAVDFDGELYLRQEGRGMLVGSYEREGRPWSPHTTPWDFGHELLEPDLDRIAPSLEGAFRHFPALERAGIRQVINGPFTFAPDANPLVGPVRGLPGFWCACGVMAGFSQGGGVGLALANWMTAGDPGFDVWAMDVARFGGWASRPYTNARVRETYGRRFSIRYPNEELPAGRPLRTVPVHDLLAEAGAQFGAVFGLEQPLWFAPPGVRERFSWRRSTDHPHVGAEVRAVREAVGLLEISGYARYAVRGSGAEGWLDELLAGRLPREGRIALAPMLKADGRVIGDFTVARLRDGSFRLWGSGGAEEYHLRWFAAHAAPGVEVEPLGARLAGLAIAGPRARELLARLTDANLGDAALPFLGISEIEVGLARCLVGRISYTGDLGYEIWMPPDLQRHVYLALKAAGEELGLRDVGLRALNALRLEKGWGGWGREYRPVYLPQECGLGRFVAMEKGDFIGRAALAALAPDAIRHRLCTFTVGARDADAVGDEPIWQGGRVVGWVTSGGYAHNAGASMAMGYVPAALAAEPEGWSVEILGERCPARLEPRPVFDPEGRRMRAA